MTALTTGVSRRVVAGDERRILRQEASITASSVTSLVTQYKTALDSTLAVAFAAQGDPAAFNRFATMLTQQGFLQVQLVQSTGSGWAELIGAGPGQTPGVVSGPSRDTLATARPGALAVGLSGPAGHRVLTVADRPTAGDVAVVAAAPLDTSPGPSTPSGSAPSSNLPDALYAGGRERPENLVLSDTSRLPLTGRRAVETLSLIPGVPAPAPTLGSRPGTATSADKAVILVMSPTGPLVGNLAHSLPWIVLAIGILGTGAGAALVEVITRRHRDTLDLVEQLGANNRKLDGAMAEQRRVEAELRRQEASFRLLFASNPQPMWVAARDTYRIVEVNDAAIEHYGYSRDEFLGMGTFDLCPSEDVKRVWQSSSLNDGVDMQPVQVVHRRCDGTPIDVEIRGHRLPFRDEDAILVLANDITDRKKYEAQLTHQALHDDLTGLANRALLHDRLEQALARSGRSDDQVAVLFLDLDRFKVINDSLGHGAGDELLVSAAERIVGALRPGDTAARFGGDEFVVLCEDVRGPSEATAIAERLVAMLSQPFMVHGQEVVLTASAGVVLAEASQSAVTLLRDADAAMYRAKDLGRARAELFDTELRNRAITRLDTELSLRRALERDELTVVYQPTVRLSDRAVVGAEALVRWCHPDRGVILPGEFIGVAEESGLIVALGEHVLRVACVEAGRWRAHARAVGAQLPVVSVNLSPRQLSHPGLIDMVTEALDRAGAEPEALVLEVTETALVDDVGRAVQALRDLRALGVGLALDDFGTGYSSLSHLRALAVDVVKVDRSFVSRLERHGNESAIVASVVQVAHALGLTVVAEGVESDEQCAELLELGCDVGQGYLFARPGPAADLGSLPLAGGHPGVRGRAAIGAPSVAPSAAR